MSKDGSAWSGMKYYYDMHIHSCVSPCAENENTPTSVVGMAKLNELDIIAVADHNTCKNLPTAKIAADFYDILLVPAIEITTQEEVHLLGYFQDVDAAVAFGDNIYDSLPDIKNRVDIFGDQHVLDEDENVIEVPEKLLINACAYSIDNLVKMIRVAGGVAVPAHINRPSDSIIASLGFIPDELGFSTVELFKNTFPMGIDVSHFRTLSSSDAHRLEDISQRENYLNLQELSVSCVLEKLEKFS